MQLKLIFACLILMSNVLWSKNLLENDEEETIYFALPQGMTEENIYNEPLTSEIRTPFPKKKKLKDYFKTQQQQLLDSALDASGNALSLPWVSIGFKLNLNSLSKDVFYRDGDKLNKTRITPLPPLEPGAKVPPPLHRTKWYQYNISISPVLGSAQFITLFNGIKFPSQFAPVIGGQGGLSIDYELIIPSKIDNAAKDKITKEVFKQVKGMAQTIIKLKMPLKSHHLLDEKKYPNGSEFSWKSRTFALFAAGADFPLKMVSAGAKYYYMVEGILKKKLKIYREGKSTYVQVDIFNDDNNSDEKSAELGLGFSFLQTETYEASAKLKVLTASKIKIKSGAFKMSFIFDLSYPESVKALNEVFKNNFTIAQSIATPIAGAGTTTDIYQGVLLLENHEQELIKKTYSLNVGLFSSRFRLKAGPLTLSLKDVLPDIIRATLVDKENSWVQGKFQYPYLKPITRASVNLKKSSKLSILFGLLALRSKDFNYNNEIITYETANGKKPINQISIVENYSNELTSETKFKKYYEPNQYIFHLLKPNLTSMLNALSDQNECYVDYKMNKHFILYPGAIKQLESVSEMDFYRAFAKIFGIDFDPADWTSKQKRKTVIKNQLDSLEKNPTTSPFVLKYLHKMYSLYRKIDRYNLPSKAYITRSKSLDVLLKEFPEVLEHIDKTNIGENELRTSLIFHSLYSKFTSTYGFIDLIAMLINQTDTNDYFLGFVLKSKNCNVQWISSPQLSVDPEIISQEIDAYLENY